MLRRMLFLALLPALAHAQTTDKVLQRIRDTKKVTIAYRTDARPFSYEDNGQPAGYTVELCKRVVASLEQQLKVQPLAVKWVPATVETRLDLVRKGQVDLECGTTTATLSRMEQVDFSNPVWVDTTGLIVRKSVGAKALGGLAGKSTRGGGRDPQSPGAGGGAEEGAGEREGRAGEELRRGDRLARGWKDGRAGGGQDDAPGDRGQAQGPRGV